MNKFIAFLLLGVVFGHMVMAHAEAADSVKVYFKSGRSLFEPGTGDNLRTMQSFLEQVRRNDAAHNIERLVVRAYSSPDGVSTANEQLSSKRCGAVTSHIVSATGISTSLVSTAPEGIAWGELRAMIAGCDSVPGREEALYIIDNTPIWVKDSRHNIIGSRKKSLMDLMGVS